MFLWGGQGGPPAAWATETLVRYFRGSPNAPANTCFMCPNPCARALVTALEAHLVQPAIHAHATITSTNTPRLPLFLLLLLLLGVWR